MKELLQDCYHNYKQQKVKPQSITIEAHFDKTIKNKIYRWLPSCGYGTLELEQLISNNS